MIPDPDYEARRALARHRSFATALLVLMGAISLVSYALPASYAVDLLQSAARAGFIGGIADWFAVTALFRHPLGLPIPHTAILPAQKLRLGRALGRFVANHVFTPDEVARALAHLDLGRVFGDVLRQPAATRPLARALAGLLPRALATLEDGRASRLMGRLLPRLLGGAASGLVVARALRALVQGGQHQEVFGFILAQVRELLATKEEELRQGIEGRVAEHGGKLVGWAIGASVARRVLEAVNRELDKMSPDGSDLRIAFDAWVGREITLLEDDPARTAQLGAAVGRLMSHPTVRAWMGDLWARLRRTLEEDAADPAGRTVAVLEGFLADLAASLQSDRALAGRLSGTAQEVVGAILPAAREQLATFIADAVSGWDTATLIDRLELRVGKDLQYVRVNGTLVGFLVGGLVFVVLTALFGVRGH